MLKFLQRVTKLAADQSSTIEAVPGRDTAGVLADASAAFQQSPPQADAPPDEFPSTVATSTTAKPSDAHTSADSEPSPLMIGSAFARTALEPLTRAKPRSIIFISSPRTQRHASSIYALLAEHLAKRASTNALVLVTDFAHEHRLTVLRLSASESQRLTLGVAEAIEMLSLTIPSAFESDSTRVARLALDEELRSGHDTAIDALKRKALSHNIGVLRTPLGYAVAPMHDGRVVAPEVFKALPASLKAGVEAKLEAFETELSVVLSHRSQLQQDYHQRLRELEREVASLAVRASLSTLAASFANNPAILTWLNALNGDLTKNASLFVSAHRCANGQTRAPIELANDPTLVRYRVTVISDRAELIAPASVDLPELFGTVSGHLTSDLSPAALRPGALARAGNGLILFDARDLLANYASWPRLKQAFRRGTANPLEVFGLEIPFDACLIITGDTDDFTAWSALDSDVPRLVRHMKAYPQTIPLTPTSTNDFKALIAAIVRDEALLPLEATAMTALLNANTITQNRVPVLSSDLDALPDLLTEASRIAVSHSRSTIAASDVRDALQLTSHST